jgi:hypothetical protein
VVLGAGCWMLGARYLGHDNDSILPDAAYLKQQVKIQASKRLVNDT